MRNQGERQLCSHNNFGLILQAQAAKDSELKHQIMNGPQKRTIKRQTPPIHTNPLRAQQSPPSNANTSPQNRIPMQSATIPNTFQLLSLQQKANSLLGNQSAYLVSAASPSISQTLAAAPALNSNSSSGGSIGSGNGGSIGRARPTSPLDLSASTPVAKRLKIESTSPGRRTTSPTTPTILQHAKTSCNSSTDGGASGADASSSTSSLLMHSQRRCHAQTDEINSWTVDQVCNFVNSIDICAEYVEVSTFLHKPHILSSASLLLLFRNTCGGHIVAIPNQ